MNKSILLSAVLICAAILLNGYFERQHDTPDSKRLSHVVVESSMLKSFEYAFDTLAGENVIMGKERVITDVDIDEVRYSDDGKKMLVDFTLRCTDGDHISSGVGLNRDDFGVYRGVWTFGMKKANFVIKEKS